MKEADHPSQIEKQPTPRVFDLSAPDADQIINRFAVERLKSGDIIIGIATWEGAERIIQNMVAKTVSDYDPDPTTRLLLKRPIHFQDAVETRDRRKGFYGTCRNFGIAILDTDLSLVKIIKNDRDPKLATTFELSRHLSNGNRLVTTKCTISLTGSRITPSIFDNPEPGEEDEIQENVDMLIANAGETKIRFFSAAIGLIGIDEKALDAMTKSKKGLAAFGENTNKRKGFGIKNHGQS